MKIILLENIKNLGYPGDIITVKPGHAKNYLFPTQKAILATDININLFNKKKFILHNKKKISYEINKLNNVNIIIPASIHKENKLYGSINTSKIIKIIKNLGFKINKKNIDNNIFIKKTGNYKLNLYFNKPKIQIKIFLIITKKLNKTLVA